MKLAVVLANLGGPDGPQAVKPFLFNLFNDRAIIGLPQPLRGLLASVIAVRRAPIAARIYEQIGGASPLLAETRAQGACLEDLLQKRAAPGSVIKVFTAMRYWHPLVAETAREIKVWAPDRIVLLPLYPQFSTTTTGSFFSAWTDAAKRIALTSPTAQICCHPTEASFVAAHVEKIREALTLIPEGQSFRLLFSAHGLPKRVIERGDPYQWQIEQTARRIVESLNEAGLDWRVCYQSRVGPLAWLSPSTEAEIHAAGAEKKGLIILPIAFVSEHSETLVELDIDYAALAQRCGVAPYIRVPALGADLTYLDGLAAFVLSVSGQSGVFAAAGERICPGACSACPHRPQTAERRA